MPIRVVLNFRNTIKLVWIGLCVSTLLLGLGAVIADSDSVYAEETVYAIMLLLSFPSGLVMGLFTDSGIDGPLSLSLVWAAAFIAGFLQWFVFLPELCDRSSTSLGLNGPNKLATAKKKFRQRSASKIKRRCRKQVVRAFDSSGHTPLERALRSTTWR